MPYRFIVLSSLLASSFLGACSGRTSTHPDGGGVAGLHIDPANVVQTMQVAGAQPDPIVFHAFDGDNDVTASVTWSIDPSPIGPISTDGRVTPMAGGKSVVHATLDGTDADASVTIKLVGDLLGPGANANTPSRFTTVAADPNLNDAAVLEYPEDGTILPANLPPVQLQWTQVADNDTYRVHFSAVDTLDVYLYGTGREISAESTAWSLITASARDQQITWAVESVGASSMRRTSMPRSFTSTSDQIDQSAIYVWQPSSGTFHLIDIAKAKDVPLPTTEPLLQPGQACSGCHRISRDGKRFGYTYNGQFQLGSLEFDASMQTFVPKIGPTSAIVATYSAFDPLEAMRFPAMLATVPDVVAMNTAGTVRLQLIDPNNGMPVASDLAAMITSLPSTVGHATLMPDWSPDGSFVVFSAYDSDANFVRDLGDDTVLSSIVESPVTFDGTTYHFGAPKTLVATADTNPDTGENDVLPSISPDGSAVAYTQAKGWWSVKNEASQLNVTGEIRLVRRSDGHVFTLTNGSHPSSMSTSNTWPQWAPTPGAKYMWIAYGSERPYGHLLSASNHNCGQLTAGQQSCKQLWVTAIDRDKLANGTDDPSAAPFWIPGQSVNEQYVSPQWTTSVIAIQ